MSKQRAFRAYGVVYVSSSFLGTPVDQTPPPSAGKTGLSRPLPLGRPPPNEGVFHLMFQIIWCNVFLNGIQNGDRGSGWASADPILHQICGGGQSLGLGSVHTGCGAARNTRTQIMEHTVANGSDHTTLQATSRNCANSASCVNWALGLWAESAFICLFRFLWNFNRSWLLCSRISRS